MREERIEVDGIPGRLYTPDGAKALLLLGHGGAMSKDDDRFVELSQLYAERTGLAVLCIDAVDHGERRPPGPAAAIPKEWHSRTSSQMVKDWYAVAQSLKSIGPAVAYVGFSMGSIFGFSVVASMPSIRAAAFVVGGVIHGAGVDDAPLRPLLLTQAARIEHAPVLMLNKTEDEYFAIDETTELFEAIANGEKHLTFFKGRHDDWPEALIDDSVSFVNQHTPARI